MMEKKVILTILWLRDNCPTAHDKDSRHRMFNILEVSTILKQKILKLMMMVNW